LLAEVGRFSKLKKPVSGHWIFPGEDTGTSWAMTMLMKAFVEICPGCWLLAVGIAVAETKALKCGVLRFKPYLGLSYPRRRKDEPRLNYRHFPD